MYCSCQPNRAASAFWVSPCCFRAWMSSTAILFSEVREVLPVNDANTLIAQPLLTKRFLEGDGGCHRVDAAHVAEAALFTGSWATVNTEETILHDHPADPLERGLIAARGIIHHDIDLHTTFCARQVGIAHDLASSLGLVPCYTAGSTIIVKRRIERMSLFGWNFGANARTKRIRYTPPPQQTDEIPYVLPTQDSEEMQRLDFQHFMLKYIIKGNYLAPIGNPQTVLDVGTGTGRWAIEMAQKFPQATVYSIDTAAQYNVALIRALALIHT